MGKAIQMAGKSKAMDLLKSALAERQAKAQKTVADTGKKWIRRSELEDQRKQEYMENKEAEEEKWRADEEERFAKLNEHLSRKESKEDAPEKAIPSHILDDALLGDDDAEPPVAIGEVIDRLRDLLSPITLFGETDMQRYKRLRQIEKEAHEGKKNPDILMLEGLHGSAKQNMLDGDENEQEEQAEEDSADEESEAEAGAKKEGGGGGGGEAPADDKSDSEDEGEAPAMAADKSDSEDEGEAIAANQRAKMMQAASQQREATAAQGEGAPPVAEEGKHPEPELVVPEVDLKFMDKCDAIRVWARKALKAWEKELADKDPEEKKKQVVKTEISAHRQVRRDVRPLQKRLRLYVMKENLLDKIYAIATAAADRRYRDASEAYLDLSIGKAAWPVGIGCGGSMLMEDAIGLHDRYNRMANVNDNAVTLNDDVTRKFVQALKRLMNVAQRYWPPDDPSNRC